MSRTKARKGMLEIMEFFSIPAQDDIESVEIRANFSERAKIIVTKQYLGKQVVEEGEAEG